MKFYVKPIAEVKEFGLSGAIADLNSFLDDTGEILGLSGLKTNEKSIASYSLAS